MRFCIFEYYSIILISTCCEWNETELETIVLAFFSSGIWFLNVEALISELENLNSLAFQIYLNNQEEDWDKSSYKF